MWLSSRSLRHSAFSLLLAWTISPGAAAQSRPQFIQPTVLLTNGPITSFLAGNFETIGATDLLYINAAAAAGPSFQVTVGELLNQPSYVNLNQNQISFPNVLNVTAALADLDNDGRTDYAFALSPTIAAGNDLCVYYGTGLGTTFPGSFSPLNAKSGCMSFPIRGGALPSFTYIAAAPFKTGALSQLILEDSSNGYLYILGNGGADAIGGVLAGFSVKAVYAIPAADGAGPIYAGDFNNDGNTDFIVNGQSGADATIYLGNGDGTFRAQPPLHFDHNVHSMLLHDMDGDGVADLVVEGDKGIIEIFHGNNSTGSPFATTSEGGTTAGLDGFSGNGGHLAAIARLGADTNLDILTTTPIGLSVLQGQGGLTFKLKGVYNVGPGRSSFALADFFGDGNLDLAVDSPQGIALLQGNSDGSFRTSSAYAAGQPALDASVGIFRNARNNPKGNLDVVVGTGTVQAQLLAGNGDGTFNALPSPANTTGFAPGTTFWSAVLPGDFDGDGIQDLLYSVTGLPLPTPGAGAGSGLYLQYGNGDGTFGPPAPISNQLLGANADNNFYGESAIADINRDGIDDIINLDTYYYDTLLSQSTAGAFKLGLSIQEDAGTNEASEPDSFSQVAAGVFAGTRPNGQDLVFQDDANITPYVNSGDGIHFTAMHTLASPPDIRQYYGGTILIADIDGDGCGDIIIPYHNLVANPANPSPNNPNQLYIWYGHCDGTFQDPPLINTLSRNYYLAAVADMNGDGLPDVILSDGYLVAILYNQGNRTFGGEQDFLAGQGINSISVADVNGDGSADLILSNGGVTLSDAVANGGKTLTSISLTPNPDVNTGGITVLLNNIKTKPVTGTLLSAPDPSEYQAAFTMTATLNPTAGVPPPTGTVQFAVGSTLVGSPVALVPGTQASTAAYTVPVGNTFPSGIEYGLSAAYGGDTLNSPVTLFATQLIQGIPTTTTLALCIGGSAPNCPVSGTPTNVQVVSPLTMSYGQVYNGTETVTDTDGTPFNGTGNLSFYQDGTILCTLLASGPQSCPPSVGMGTHAGTHVFTSVYFGDATHSPSTSNAVTINVLQDTNSATLTGSPNPALFGQPVTFTGVFTGNFAPPTGTAVFSSGATQLGTATLTPSASGVTSTAAFTTSTLPAGTDPITVTYAATQDFAAATANTTETILPLTTTATTLTSSVNPSGIGQSVTFTTTVTASTGAGAAPAPIGSVTFLDGGTSIGSGVLNGSGIAVFTTSTLAVGKHNITASYPGNTTTSPSVSAVLVQVVNNSSFTLTVTPTPVSVGVGNVATLTVTVTSLNGFNQAVTLGCTNLPQESACLFATPSIASGAGSIPMLVSTTAPHNCGSTEPYFTGKNGGPGPVYGLAPFALPALAGLAILFVPGRRRWLRALVATVAVAGAMQITGCGNCTDLGTRPNTYTFQVYGAAAGTSEVESQSVTINVTI